MLTFAQPQCPLAETDTDGVNRLSLAHPLELGTVVMGIRAPECIRPSRLLLYSVGKLSESLPELLSDT
jgi:hypothetical protein